MSIVDDNVTWLSMACGTTGCPTIRRYSRTTNGGLTWTTGVIDLGTASTSLQISNIHGISATVAYVTASPRAGFTATGGIWKTTDGGATWARQSTASYNDAASFANVVYFFNENEGVSMGDPVNGYFEIYTTTNGGANWTRVGSSPALIPFDPEDYGLTNQFTTLGNTIWFGTTFGRIIKSTDKGLTWTVSQSPIPDFGGGINGDGSGDLAFTDQSNGLLQTDAYELYKTSDGGVTWTPIEVQADTKLKNFGIAAIPGLVNTYISVGEDLETSPERGSAYTLDGGVTWYNIDDAEQVDGGVVQFKSPTNGFCSGFTTSAAVGGIWKWNGLPLLKATSFSNDNLFTATPNPTTGLLELSGKNISNVIVYDILGKQVSATNYSALNNVSLNLSALNNGVYMVKVTNNTGNTSTIKVVKQ